MKLNKLLFILILLAILLVGCSKMEPGIYESYYDENTAALNTIYDCSQVKMDEIASLDGSVAFINCGDLDLDDFYQWMENQGKSVIKIDGENDECELDSMIITALNNNIAIISYLFVTNSDNLSGSERSSIRNCFYNLHGEIIRLRFSSENSIGGLTVINMIINNEAHDPIDQRVSIFSSSYNFITADNLDPDHQYLSISAFCDFLSSSQNETDRLSSVLSLDQPMSLLLSAQPNMNKALYAKGNETLPQSNMEFLHSESLYITGNLSKETNAYSLMINSAKGSLGEIRNLNYQCFVKASGDELQVSIDHSFGEESVLNSIKYRLSVTIPDSE